MPTVDACSLSAVPDFILAAGGTDPPLYFLLDWESVPKDLFLTCFREYCKEAKYAPWDATSTLDARKRAASKVEPKEGMYKNYFWTDRKKQELLQIPGIKYLRVNMLVPENTDVSHCIEEMERQTSCHWWDSKKRYAYVLACQAVDPVTIGFFMRSNEQQSPTELQAVLRDLVKDPTLGLVYKEIEKESKNKADTTKPFKRWKRGEPRPKEVKAIHVECDRSRCQSNIIKIEAIYKSRDYPLGISLVFIRCLGMPGMRSDAMLQGFLKCYGHHDQFGQSVSYIEVEIHNLDEFLPAPLDHITLRQWLMTLRVRSIGDCISDRLFLSLTPSEYENTFNICYHELVSEEAVTVAENLALAIKHELRINPNRYIPNDIVGKQTIHSWDEILRQVIYRGGHSGGMFAGVLDSQTLHEIEQRTDDRMEQVDEFTKVLYHQCMGNCDNTVVSGTHNTLARAMKLRAINGRRKMAKKSGTVIDLDGDGSAVSGMTGTTGTTGTGRSKRKEAAEAAVRQNNQEWEKKQQEQADKHKLEMENQRQNFAKMMEESKRAMIAESQKMMADMLKNARSQAQAHTPHRLFGLSDTALASPFSPEAPPIPFAQRNRTTALSNSASTTTANATEAGSASKGAKAL